LFYKALRFFHTIKYLKIKQIFWRAINLFPRFIFEKNDFPTIEKVELEFLIKKEITSDYNSFLFLNEKFQLLEVGWDNPSLPKLWRYNLHYFDFLRQFELENEEVQLQTAIISKWIKENPFGKGTAWEPYPTSLRIINWIKWHSKTKGLTEEAKLSLWNQARWLAKRPEYHLLGNHLFVNSKALLFASALFGLDDKSRIYNKALRILTYELEEQFLTDGAHFELSPMYHSLAMEDLLDLFQLSSFLPSNFPSKKILEKYCLGMKWLSLMKYNNEEFAHFNDCSNGIAPSYKELEELAFKIDLNQKPLLESKFVHFSKSGFAVAKDSKVHLVADIGPIGPDYLPGHAHADTLSFELAIEGKRVIVNSGTSEYGLSQERFRQRSTAAHSTIEVDGQSSSEVWSGFRVARRARVIQIEINELEDKIEFSAVHDGYTRLPIKSKHKRQWNLGEDYLEILDEVSGRENCIQLRFFLHPDIEVFQNDTEILLNSSSRLLAKINSNQSIEVLSTTYHDSFGVSKKNKCLLINGTTPFSSKVIFNWIK
jgi:uncharacterized heparinase superfamily protein